MDTEGNVVRQATVASDPAAIAERLEPYMAEIASVGFEAGPTSAWLARGLRERGVPVIVIDAAHVAAALRSGFRNKTDRNDARGIAGMMRVNTYRAVWVKSPEAQRDRTLLAVREQLRRQSLDLRNNIWSILQAEGLKPPKLANTKFQTLLDVALADAALGPVLRPLKAVVDKLDEEIAALDRRIKARAKASEPCRLLMTAPGVGPLVALTYVVGMDDPARFAKSQNVGAHFGLTPRRYQSGNMDWSGGISRAGDAGVRRALYQAANVLITSQPGLVRAEVMGCPPCSPPWTGQGQSGPRTQARRRAAQDVDHGRTLSLREAGLTSPRHRSAAAVPAPLTWVLSGTRSR